MDSAVVEYLEVPDAAFNGEEEAIDVFCWRMEELMRTGYSAVIAGTLAARPDIDLHRARVLREAGCDEKTAFLILY